MTVIEKLVKRALDNYLAADRVVVPEVGHAGFGALIAGERRLYKGLALHLERGPVARLSLQALVKNGAEAGSTAGERFIALSHPLIFSVESGDGCSTELGGRVI